MKAFVAACVVMALGASAFAQSASARKSEAVTAFKAGQALYERDDYEGAARQFKTAYDLDPDPVYLFNIAQAHRLGKKCADAGEYYRRYLAEAKKAPNVEAVKASIAEVETCAKEQQDAAAAAEAAAAAAATPAPVPVVAREPVRDEPPRSNKRLVGYIVGGGGVALAGLGFLFMTQVRGFEDDANAVCPNPCTTWDSDKKTTRAEIDDKAALREKLMIGSWIAGGAAIAAGVYLVVTGGAATEHGVAITPTRNGAVATIRF
jgi:tetratricopeptide (TPR) repeat protein